MKKKENLNKQYSRKMGNKEGRGLSMAEFGKEADLPP